MTNWDCRTHVRMTSSTSWVERTDLDFKISVALGPRVVFMPITLYLYDILKLGLIVYGAYNS